MNNKTTGLVLLLSILVLGLFVHMIWKPMSYLEGITNPSGNKYDGMYDSAIGMLTAQSESYSKQIAATPGMADTINKTLGSELTEIIASKGYQALSTSSKNLTPLMDLMKNLSPENASMISQIVTTLIQFLTDLKAQVLTINSDIGGGASSSASNSNVFSKMPLVIS
jgi:hypothetical protein